MAFYGKYHNIDKIVDELGLGVQSVDDAIVAVAKHVGFREIDRLMGDPIEDCKELDKFISEQNMVINVLEKAWESGRVDNV